MRIVAFIAERDVIGRIWIAREGLVPPRFDARRYDLLDSTGRVVGTIKLARPGQLMAATAEAIWVVELESDDLPTLLRYPILR